MPAAVVIYTTDYCPYCVRAKRLLEAKRAPFEEVSCEGRDDLRRWLVSASGQRTVPQVFINGEAVGGFSDLADLEKAGQLDGLLAASPGSNLPALPR